MALPALTVGDPGCQLNWEYVDGRVPQLVTSLPSLVGDGQEVYYVANATNGATWHLRYRSASSSSYKWECVGGAPLYAFTSASNAIASATYGLVNPSITVPLAGDYLVHYGAKVDADADYRDCYLTVKNGSNAASDADAINFVLPSSASHYHPVATERLFTVAAGAALALYARAAAGTVGTRDKFMRITPVRVR